MLWPTSRDTGSQSRSISRIRVDSRIVSTNVVDGVYEVPTSSVGHHEGSALPGQPGNLIYLGMSEACTPVVSSPNCLSSQPGDVIAVFTESHRAEWEVLDTVAVPKDGYGSMCPTADTRITLCACATSRPTHQGFLAPTGYHRSASAGRAKDLAISHTRNAIAGAPRLPGAKDPNRRFMYRATCIGERKRVYGSLLCGPRWRPITAWMSSEGRSRSHDALRQARAKRRTNRRPT